MRKPWNRHPDPLTPLPQKARSTMLRSLLTDAGRIVLRASLRMTPLPAALAIRKIFAKSAFSRSMSQLRQAPVNVLARIDEYYGTLRDERMDIYVPEKIARSNTQLPTVVWTHGGGFLGGAKEELSGYLRMIADRGFTVVGVDYTRAPEAKYPTPVLQVFSALRYLQSHAAKFHVDPTRIVLAGDSSGAQISAQIAALSSNPNYAQRMGIAPTVSIEHIRGVILCCGIYDLTTLDSNASLKSFFDAVGWSYSGSRDFTHDHGFVTSLSVMNHINPHFPPTFITAGNSDPLLSQSITLAATLRKNGVKTEALFYPPEYEPKLSHEYQFDLNLREGRHALQQIIQFVDQCIGSDATSAGQKSA